MRHISKLTLIKESGARYFRYIEHGRDSIEGAYEAWGKVSIPHANGIETRALNTQGCGLRSFRRVWRDCFMQNS